MRPPNFSLLRRRSTGQLPHETLQQLGIQSDQHNPMSRIDEQSPPHSPPSLPKQSTKKKTLELSPTEAVPTGKAFQKYLLKKRGSLDLNTKDLAKVKSQGKMSSNLSSSTSALSKKKKNSLSSLMAPVIGSRPSSPCRDRSRSPNLNDASDSDSPQVTVRVDRTSSTLSRNSKSIWHYSSSNSLTSIDLAPQRELCYEEEMEIHLTKLTAAAHHWRDKFRHEMARSKKLQLSMAEQENDNSAMIKALKEHYDLQLFQLRAKLVSTIETADAILIDNQRLDDQLKVIQATKEQKTRELEQRIARDTSTIASLRREMKELDEKLTRCDEDKHSLLLENEQLITRIMEMKHDIARKAQLANQKWDDYYALLLELALGKLNKCEQFKPKPSRIKVFRTPMKDSPPKKSNPVSTPRERMDSRSNDSINSMTSLESLLSDLTEVVLPRTAPPSCVASPMSSANVDCNDNLTDSKRYPKSTLPVHQLPTSRSISEDSNEPRRSVNESDFLTSSAGSEYSITSYLKSRLTNRISPRQLRKRFSGISTSFSDSNICDLDPTANPSSKLSGLIRVGDAVDGHLTPEPRRLMVKAHSEEIDNFDPDGICLSDPGMEELGRRGSGPSRRALTDTLLVPRHTGTSPLLNRKSGKKQSKVFSLKLEMPKLRWKRRNTADAATLSEKEINKLRTHMDLSERLSMSDVTASSLVPVSSVDESAPFRLSRSSSITSSESTEPDPDPNPQQGSNSSGYSGFDRLNRRRNGIAAKSQMQVSDAEKRRRSKLKKGESPVKMVGSSDDLDVLVAQGSIKNKFFKRKAASVKR